MHLFQIVSEDFFKPLTSKYKKVYVDCIELIYNAYKNELSFGVEREVLLVRLEEYFAGDEIEFTDEEEAATDARAKANAVLRVLKDCGWLEYEIGSDYVVKVNLFDYAATIIESFSRIIKDEEMEYQSVISQIHATLHNKEAYVKPYEYIIKRVIENTEELIGGLKKLSTMIKKRIDAITRNKTAAQIVEDFFVYHREIGSKAYHRIKTSDNVSYFRIGIIENLRRIIEDRNIFSKAVTGYMELEQVTDRQEAEEQLTARIHYLISSFYSFDQIIEDIDNKNTRYIASAIARAKFLLSNTSSTEGKLNRILALLADQFNRDETLNINDEADAALLQVFDIFPQNFLDSDSFYVMPISRKMELPQVISGSLGLSAEERRQQKLRLQEKNRNRFSRKNINDFVLAKLRNNEGFLASTLPLASKRDLIRLIFISLYGRHSRTDYNIELLKQPVSVNGFQFVDFRITRSRQNGNI